MRLAKVRTKAPWLILAVSLAGLGAYTGVWGAGEPSLPHTFVSATPARAAEVNANFAALVQAVTDNVTRRTRITYTNYLFDSSGTWPNYELFRFVGFVTKHAEATDFVIHWDSDARFSYSLGEASFRLQLRNLLTSALYSSGVSGGDAWIPLGGGTHPIHATALFQGVPAGYYQLEVWLSFDAPPGQQVEEIVDPGAIGNVLIEESPSR